LIFAHDGCKGLIHPFCFVDRLLEEIWQIWVKVGDGDSRAIHIANTADVSAFKDAIKAKFAGELAGIGITKLVVKASQESLAVGTPKIVDPTTFERVLGNRATLAAVLKPDIAGEYKVYVELPAKPRKPTSRCRISVFAFHFH